MLHAGFDGIGLMFSFRYRRPQEARGSWQAFDLCFLRKDWATSVGWRIIDAGDAFKGKIRLG